MRIAIAALLIAALPAAAQGRSPAARPTITPAQAAAALQNPLVQEGLAQAVTQLAGIVLDTRIGPLAELADPREDLRPSDTLRDLKHRDDPQFERHLHDSTRHALASAGAIAGGATTGMAELDRTATRLQAALAPLLAYAGSRRDHDRDRPDD